MSWNREPLGISENGRYFMEGDRPFFWLGYSMSATERESAVSIAKGMVEVQWTPTKYLTGWRGNSSYSFPAGQTVTGNATR